MSYAETEYAYGFSVKSNALESAFRIFVGFELTEIRPAKAIKKTRTKAQKSGFHGWRYTTAVLSIPIDAERPSFYLEVVLDFQSGRCPKIYARAKCERRTSVRAYPRAALAIRIMRKLASLQAQISRP